jgi:predicted Holliday junction resolvase-like endonuclease
MDVIALVIVIITVAAFLGILLVYFTTRYRYESKYRMWQEELLVRWEEEREKAVREAVTQSRAVLGGKFTEQMAPYLPEFKYDPTEARFIGSPIDLIVFPGLSSGEPEEIVIMEVKSGRTAQLTPQERKIRQLIEDGMVRWELLQKPQEAES